MMLRIMKYLILTMNVEKTGHTGYFVHIFNDIPGRTELVKHKIRPADGVSPIRH